MEDVTIYLLVAGAVGWLFALFLFLRVKAQSYQLDDGFGVPVNEGKSDHTVELIDKSGQSKKTTREINATLEEIFIAVREGADSFLMAEYKICLIFVACFEVVVIVLVAHVGTDAPNADSNGFDWGKGAYSGLAFGIGALCSICTGYVSMKVAVFSNARTAVAASAEGAEGWRGAFSTAMNAGGVAGFLLCSTAMLVLFLVCNLFNLHWRFDAQPVSQAKELFEAIAGFGLGGSTIAMFGRVGGGIFTKAADVGSDLAGKVVAGIPEDDPRNPGVIADNVGDNVGDVAGMGSDLFGSFAEASCAALIVGASSPDILKTWNALLFPLVVSATGIFGGVITHFFATDVWPVKCENDVLRALKVQLGISTLLVTASLWPIASYFLPASFEIDNEKGKGSTLHVFFSIAVGLWGGCIIGFVTEYFTSYDYKPTQEVAQSTETGAATNIIYGIALGYKSAVIPILILCIDVYVSFSMLGMYGVALCALGMLSTLSSCLTIDVYGPICDNGGGFAEMAEMHPRTREKTDALDAAGNTTAAIGKGFAIGSAALVSLALLGAFVTRVSHTTTGVMPFCNGRVSLLEPVTFAMLICGAMIPYWFSAMTMKSVGKAAMDMVKEVARQFREIKGLLEGTPGHDKPQHGECIRIATQASLREMILPGALVIFAPLIVGSFLGVNAVVGFLSGSLCSGVQIAVSMSNTGGAWDNAKKYVEKGKLLFAVPGTEPVEYKVQLKGSEAHKAAVVGDTVGDPFKDTSGPAINIVMKLMAILSLVFADFFMSLNQGRGILDVYGGQC